MQSQRRSYSKSFKAQVIQECAQPGASIASVALSHSLNANLVHKWIRVQAQKTMVLQPPFIPLPLQLAGVNPQAASSATARLSHNGFDNFASYLSFT
ncbi:transposase [Pseudomonas sp. R4-34-07]|uniref:transposase n=1 Tax=Pseudomonas sp. R4-34-07 TaxID=658642 RepID=UPI0013DE262B|nr:transposase [Pseudomonas sp. R4-34-07]